jgi:antitoxin (DNA-binding transcriptional repressor) of toxin-antitoxin stability system
MAASASIRELRNHFPKVRKLVEQEGEVLVTDQGTPRYRLLPYTSARAKQAPTPKDYLKRLRCHQPRPLSSAAAKALHESNRGDR